MALGAWHRGGGPGANTTAESTEEGRMSARIGPRRCECPLLLGSGCGKIVSGLAAK